MMWMLTGPDGTRIVMPHGHALATGYRLARSGASLPTDSELATLWGRCATEKAAWLKAGYRIGRVEETRVD